ncbi:MAG: histidine phosphatase family protein, partial [Thermoflexales bacterium]|nr:histidine phosphatase family protein [Thermoflexales bacterium]
MPIILLIRHATTEFVKSGRLPGRTPNIHLNEEGRQQAQALRRALEALKVDAIYSSPLERALETALPLAQAHGVAIRVVPELADVDTGAFTGREIKQLAEDAETRAFWRTVQERPSAAVFPHGEGLLAMQQRVVRALEAIAAAHPDLPLLAEQQAADKPKTRPQHVVVVAHADVIKAALAHYLAMPFDAFQRLSISPASISTLSAVSYTHLTLPTS